MKKVMLVDDEILVRESIRDCVDWEKEGFIYCGDASDGEVALPLIERHHPDILITDIKMPFMNGLELSAIIRKQMPGIKIVILSGHDEFEYARAALRAGVEEYCLKPVSSADIVRVLHEISSKIDAERFEKDKLNKQQLLHSGNSRQKLLSDLCCGLITTAEAMHAAGTLSLPLASSHYAVVITDIRCLEGTAKLDQAHLQQIESFLADEIHQLIDCLSYKRSHTETIWLFKGSSSEQLNEAVWAALKRTSLTAEKRFSCSIAAGAGSITDRLQGIHISYLEAEDDKHWRRMARQSRRDLVSAASGSGYPTSPAFDRQRYIDFLKLGSPKQAPSFLASITEELQKIDWRGALYGCYLLNDLTLEALQAAREIYRGLDLTLEHMNVWQRKLEEVRGPSEAVDYLSMLLEQFWQWRNESTDKYAELILQVKHYIMKHYHNDRLSLQEAADYVNVSPSHLSKVFSQETGQTFIEFLTHTRIRKAMELLQTTHAKSYEIAHQIGYNDAHYFSNLFKRITGMTTTRFRKEAELTGTHNAIGGAAYDQSNGKAK